MINGFDASEFQVSVDFATAKSNGYPFTMLRGAIGATGLDPRFIERAKAAEAAGVLVMEYGFAYPHTSSAIDEADAACADADKAGGLHVIFLDTEGAGVPANMTRDELTQFILTWAKHVESRGYTPGSYMNTDFLQHRVNVADLKHLILWQAEYETAQPTVVGGWHPTFWQKSETGHVPGVSGNVDLDVYFGTYADLQSLCKKKRTEAVK